MTDVTAPLVRLALVVRLATLAVGMIGLVGKELTASALVAVFLLAATSAVGLVGESVMRVIVRHPIIALFDVLIVLGVLVFLGINSPLIIATFSTAFLVGVLFPLRLTLLLGLCLVLGYVNVLNDSSSGAEAEFLVQFMIPITYACLLAIGQSFRHIAERQAQIGQALRDSERDAAAGAERTRIAREMHDTFAKSLQGIALGATALDVWIKKDPNEASRQARLLARAANDAVRETRRLLLQLRQSQSKDEGEVVNLVVEEGSLAAAIEQICTEREAHHGLPSVINIAEALNRPSHARLEVIAAMAEALDNAAAHSKCNVIRVTAVLDGADVVVRISDDGEGFDIGGVKQKEQAGHFGLRGIHERMEEVAGTADIRSVIGLGTVVTLRVPLDMPYVLRRTRAHDVA